MIEGDIKYSSGKIGIVYGRYNEDIVNNLYKGCLLGLEKYNIPLENIISVHVPGAFEIPLVAKKLIQDKNCDVVITLGLVLKGETDHYTYVCKEVADGIMNIQLETKVPIIFEVLMVENYDDAVKRSNMDNLVSNKGYIAALNAIELLDLHKKI